VPRAAATPGTTVEVWLTTGDQQVLLARQPDIVLGRGGQSGGAPVISVDPSRKYQEMIGFGGAMTDASAFLIQTRMSATDRERLMQDLFGRDSGVGFSFVRVPMGASDFSVRHYSYDDIAGAEGDSSLAHFSIDADRAAKLPLLRRALAINPRLKVVASPWSPPAWMKTTNSLIKGTLRQDYYDSFAEYFVKFIRGYGAAGVPIYAITIQNEPNFEPENYPGMHLDAKVRAEIIGMHLGPSFDRSGIRTLIWDWDHNWDLPQQPLVVLADSAARRYVQGVAWHCYGGEVGAQSTVHDRYPGKDAYFTECSGGDWSPKFDENLKWTTANLVIGATRNWARGVLMWNLALDENHGPHLGGCQNCRGMVTIDSKTGSYKREVEYYSFAHASKFVRPGAHRIASESNDSTLANVAFQNPDNGTLVVIVLNSAAAPRAFAVHLGENWFSYTLPAAAVATFVWR
jgi:glucosylceramidase